MGGGNQCRVGTGGNQLSNELLRIGGTDDGLADEDDIGSATGETHDVMGTPHSPGGDTDDLSRQDVGDLIEQAAVDGQGIGVPCVDGDDAGAGLDCDQGIASSAGLHNGTHPQGVDPFNETFEH